MVDDVLIAVAAGILIVRQFQWRSAEPWRMLVMPLALIAVGLGWLGFELDGGFQRADWLLIGELVLVAGTGAAMGCVTRFRQADGLQYRLTGAGIALWAVFLAVRVGSFALAGVLGAHLLDATGLILVSFGVNRFAASLVVRRRIARCGGKIPAYAQETAGTRR
ncbi:hypothetical protein G3I59_01920 [Amycolatopsis rubida]|uniref:DUF1453 domain-containing protein n=1 Tax=Amycolatopsis rubida TaxID=112413 RepID=A0ABX0BGQ6_9PSEU|nr:MULTISPECIES: hypothetical protein [Amycolatopsis]MYW89420.1 hypothetical protein [Amycolatopsis rubida]NEC54397.1 hypothetical protein [Amycolatopsis rubida]OAP25070.1 hypothetical protein A4R44_04141 [Amycolatopsis sp. M39]